VLLQDHISPATEGARWTCNGWTRKSWLGHCQSGHEEVKMQEVKWKKAHERDETGQKRHFCWATGLNWQTECTVGDREVAFIEVCMFHLSFDTTGQ